MTQVVGVHGIAQSETYLVNVALPQGVVFTGLRVTKGAFFGGDVLIGMDIITSGDFAVSNSNGLTKFSFRTPPGIEHIDFVAEINKMFPVPGATRAARRRAEKLDKRRRQQ